MVEEFIKCFRPFKRAAMTLMWPTVNMSLTPLVCSIGVTCVYISLCGVKADTHVLHID